MVSTTKELTGKQRAMLKARAHSLKPVVQVGKNGVDERLAQSTDEVLEARELIKVKVLESCYQSRDEVAQDLAERTGAQVVGGVGRVAILFRAKPDGSGIELP